ncbi:Cro/CI family transcriptional regulator [Paraburkholderia sp. Cpub6]|uniref:transcriptional regulator n=1 Tax=Paraburkholderia sp. Cpub6 TaxID=2723094 RepID=UPI00160D1068|nr:Cro/CI family transcriptional regulator [Paraburkholderia sp. Cpub6]MBB5462908.1 DNA-binding transcriptional regulator YdaS (Cro superfamily) [Paraburkholderia sp. Cpub6]
MNKHPIAIAAAAVGGYKALADILGVTKGAVHQWMSPDRQVPIEHCTPIEQATSGAVTRQMLRPDDWESIWPELAGKGGISATDRAAASDDVQPPAGNVKRGDKMARMVI